MTAPILIVDDDLDYQAAVAAVLKGEGLDTASVPDGKAAWAAIRDLHPDVVLVDWNMPKADGIKLLKQLRADNDFRDVYAIMVTARSEQSDIVVGIRAGADDYLTKPFDNEELIARVRVGLRTRGLQRELSAHVRRSTVLEMAGSIAHEIGNPLTAARLLQERLGNSPQLQQYPDLLKELAELGSELKRIEELVRKAQSITSVRVIPYAGDINIIDLDGTGDSRSRH